MVKWNAIEVVNVVVVVDIVTESKLAIKTQSTKISPFFAND